MKPIYALKTPISRYLLATVCIFISSFHVKAQTTYATSQTNAINGLCVLCAIVNPNNPVNGSLTDYSQFDMTLGVLGVTESQTLIFPSPVSAAADSLIIQIGSGNSILSLNLFGGVSVQTANGNTLNNDAQFITGPILRLLNGNTLAEVVLKPTQSFDRVTLTVNSNLLGLLNSFRIYYASRKPVVAAPVVSPTSASIHLGDSITLEATGVAGSTITWYSALTGGTLLFTGDSFRVHPTVTTTYYAEASIGNSQSVRTPVVVTVTPAIVVAAPVVSPTSDSILLGDSVTLHATGAAGSTITWYSAMTGGTLLFTGSALLVHPTVTTTYYAEASIGNSHSPRTAVVVTVTVLPPPVISPTSDSIHLGDSVTLHATGAAGSTITWYSAMTGGTLLFTGSAFLVHPTVTTTYYAEASIGNSQSVRTPVVVTVTPAIVVAAPVVSPTSDSIYLGDSVTLHATGAAGSTITWYSAMTGGTLLFTGGAFLVHPTATTTYYAQASIGNSHSPRTAVVVTVTVFPPPVIYPDSAQIFYGDSIVLQAKDIAGSTITWYNASTGGTLLVTGAKLLVAPRVTTTYYAEASIGNRNSSRTAVVVTVNPDNTLGLVAQPDSVCSGGNSLISLLNAKPQVRYQLRVLSGSSDTVIFLTSSHNTYMASHITGNIGVSIEKATDTITNATTTDILNVSNVVVLKSGCPAPVSDDIAKRTGMSNAMLTDSLDKPTNHQLSIAPNPTSGYIHLTGNQDLTGATIVLYNMQGAVLQSDILESNDFQIKSSIPTGIYIVRVFTMNKQVLTSRVIIRK